MDMFRRAAKNLWLSPEERAVRKLLKGMIWSALLTGFVTIMPILSNPQHGMINWLDVFYTGAGTTALAFILSLDKYVTAHFQPSTIVKQPDGLMLPIPDIQPDTQDASAPSDTAPLPTTKTKAAKTVPVAGT